MAKFKCKECHKKYKVNSLDNIYNEINCNRFNCPLLKDVQVETKTKVEPTYTPRQSDILEFDEFDATAINIISKFETELPPKIIVINNDDFSNYM